MITFVCDVADATQAAMAMPTRNWNYCLYRLGLVIARDRTPNTKHERNTELAMPRESNFIITYQLQQHLLTEKP